MGGSMRRALRVLVGFGVGCLIGAYTALLFAITPAELTALPWDAAVDRIGWIADAGWKLAFLVALFSLPIGSLAIVIGERRSIRRGTYYAVTGLTIGLVGYVAQASGVLLATPMVAVAYSVVAYATTGAIAGSVYWMIAGRKAGSASAGASIRTV